MRDFAVVGGAAGFLAPYAVLSDVGYAAECGLRGAAFGLALGAFSAYLFAGRARRWRKIVLVPLGLALGAVWGASAGAVVSSLMLGASALVSGIAGALLLGWFWLAYAVRRVNGRATLGVVIVAVLSGGLIGRAAIATIVVLYLW